LSYFHAFLVREHDAPPLDLRGLGGAIIGMPEVGLVVPREYQAAVRILTAASAAPGAHSIVEVQQAKQALALGYASGARSAEVNLRERRDLVTEDGRPALLVRTNRFAGTKTYYSSRVLSLDGFIPNSELESIKQDNGVIGGNLRSDMPLFPDTDAPGQPTDPDVLSGLIGRALRSVTGEPRARQYWLRHNAASMEFLVLFADDNVIRAIKRDDDIAVPFPPACPASDAARRLGGNDCLSQIHAAAFRARRGHSTLRTSLTTYIHTVNLIEPMASRFAMKTLTSKGLARLCGRKEEWVRQIAFRAGVSMADSPGLRSALGNALVSGLDPSMTIDTSSSEPAGSSSVAVSPGAVARCAECFFRSGNLEEAIARLGASAAACEVARRTLMELPVRPSALLPGESGAARTLLGTPTQGQLQPFDLKDRILDRDGLGKLLARMRRVGKKLAPKEGAVWDLILRGADTREQVIRCMTSAEIVNAYAGLSDLAKDAFPSRKAVLIVPPHTGKSVIEREIRSMPILEKALIIERPLKKPLDRSLPVAVGLRSEGGQIRLATLVFAASVWRVWRSICLQRLDGQSVL
jgi:hypothetical protein